MPGRNSGMSTGLAVAPSLLLSITGSASLAATRAVLVYRGADAYNHSHASRCAISPTAGQQLWRLSLDPPDAAAYAGI